MIVLSILMCSTPERQKMFDELSFRVASQIFDLEKTHPSLGNVEILWDDSKRFLDGGLSIGKKRQGLVKQSSGKYLAFLDSDEDIAPNYVETLVRLCHSNPDVVTFRNLTKTDNYWTVIDMSLSNISNEEATPDKIVRRLPWHICPVKSEYAKLYEFEDINYGEDWNWFKKVMKHCKTETHTDQILHQYNHSSKTSEADKITQHVLSKS